MGKVMKPGVTIKGTREGLTFYLDDARPFPNVLEELKHKLENRHAASIWDGPEMKVVIKLGTRKITRAEETQVRELFSIRKNLIIHRFETDSGDYLQESGTSGIRIKVGTVRSGQVLTHSGDLLFMGDVNPGGTIKSTGSIYVLGALRGLAHAGMDGDASAIIVASVFRPTQLRIADAISRPPDEWDESDVGMKYAFKEGDAIIVERIQHLARVRPEFEWKDNRKRFFL
ncbi:septum site-determining protein MinC [Staphylospora marina]|uniref:septum site-determining protein MinC n=1 Tax=Staphylospora marina TaxID=2490858 RepID=UPI001F152234|nr:septum site-determining protein MinC [Staphylospora marina]